MTWKIISMFLLFLSTQNENTWHIYINPICIKQCFSTFVNQTPHILKFLSEGSNPYISGTNIKISSLITEGSQYEKKGLEICVNEMKEKYCLLIFSLDWL